MPTRVAPSCLAVLAQANAMAPNRSRASDGTVGDAAHRKRKSDHVPDAAGWVHAADLTNDPANGCNAHALADTIVARRDPRVAYVISRRRIASAIPADGQPSWTWRRYTGVNPHDRHIHISIRHTPAARNDTSAWFEPTEEQDDMSTPDYRRGLVRQLYWQFLGRHPESAQVQEERAQRILEVGYDAVVRELADSQEAKDRRGG